MKERAVSGIMLALLFIGLLTLAFNIQPISAQTYETIFIKADGSVDPPDAPIQSDDNVTYYFTDNIKYEEEWNGLVVERSNIVLDGNGYTLHAVEHDGLVFSGLNNVTVQNMRIQTDYGSAIRLSNVNNVTIQNTTLSNIYGVSILLSSSFNNTISGNTVTYAYGGCIILSSSSFNTISGNNIIYTPDSGISLFSSPFNIISGNHITNSLNGIELSASSNNTISGNNITANLDSGIIIKESSNNTISGNNITDNYERGIFFVNSSNNTVSGNNITDNSWSGIRITVSSSNTISANNITDNERGIIFVNSSENKFYHNNFIDNAQQVYDVSWNYPDSPSINVWDNGYPSGGNYWSNYVGVDEYSGVNQDEPNHDGFGDTPYVIDQDNQDNHPFLRPCPQPPWIPISSFDYASLTPVAYETVTFDASASYDIDGYIVSYAWDFGDGNITTTSNPIIGHAYTPAGIYLVTLTVTDNDGLTDVISESIDVGKISTSVSISTSCPSTYVGFDVQVTGTLRDMHGTALQSETVVLYYTFSGISEWVPITSDITDNLGGYHAVWIPPATGYFVIKSEWAGNATHSETNNTTTLSSLVYNNQYVFSVESNSTITELAFNTTDWTLSFAATGPDGTRGYVKVTVAKSLVGNPSDIRVLLDGEQLEFSIASIDDSWLLSFTYEHSTHQVAVDLDVNIIPEFPTWTLMLLILVVLIAASAIYKRNARACAKVNF